jgi:uridine monophosphate synthetase
MYLYQYIARQAQTWGSNSQIGFVVGATRPQALHQVRTIAPHNWILSPGVGAQGGNLQDALNAGLNSNGSGLIIPVSRGVIYTQNPREAARSLVDQINLARQTAPVEMVHKDLILELHETGCIQFGSFTLASGKKSPIYIDLRRMSASPELLRKAAQAYAEMVQPLSFKHVAAVPYAALTIGTAIALDIGRSLIYPRKETKSYGTGKTVEGVYSAGDTALVVEDLVTSGGSVLKAINQLEEVGLQVADVAVLIDREQGGAETLAAAGYRLHAVLKLTKVLQVLYHQSRISSDKLKNVLDYLKSA